MQSDAKGRALKARRVNYVQRAGEPGQVPTLESVAEGEPLTYEYDSDDDRIGRLVMPTGR